MKKIIIVEKRELIAEEILKVVKVRNYKVEVVKTNTDAFLYYNSGQTKAIVLENNHDGLSRILQRIRLEDWKTVIFVKGQPKADEEIETILGEGADNYITHFTSRELKAYLQAWFRFADRQEEKEYVLNERVHLAVASQRLYLPGRSQILSECEFRVLELLARNKGEVVAYEELIEGCWFECNIDTKTYLCKCVKRLRHILEEDTGLTITNVYKRGYMLEDKNIFNNRVIDCH